MDTNVSKTKFDNTVHKLGLSTTLLTWVFFLGIPFGVCTYFNLDIDYTKMLSVALPIAAIFGIIGLCEKLSMAPIIGSGAVYLSSATGNVQNMKLPAALNAMNILGCEEGSEKGKVISIIAVAVSSVVTTVIVFSGMLFLAPIMAPILSNPVIKPAFDNMLPALLGPLVLPIVIKSPKASIVPFTFAIIFALLLGASFGTLQSVVMVVVILLSLAIFKITTPKSKIEAPKEESNT